MDVYLIPTNLSEYALYCEPDDPTPVEASSSSSWWGRMRRIFNEVLEEGEAIRRSPDAVPARGHVRRWISHKLAETVAEQRLLWYLRGAGAPRLLHPDDLAPADALAAVRRLLKVDRDKHRRWMVIDTVLVVVATPFALLPGPNVLAYYFIFRAVGHFLSMRGAQQGLTQAAWAPVASAPLRELREALALDVAARDARVADLAAALGLEHLRAFVDQVSGN